MTQDHDAVEHPRHRTWFGEEREPPQNDSAPASGYLSWFGSDEAAEKEHESPPAGGYRSWFGSDEESEHKGSRTDSTHSAQSTSYMSWFGSDEEKESEKEDVDPRSGSYLSWFTGDEVTAEEKEEVERSGSYLSWCMGDEEDSDSRSASYLSWFTGEEVPTRPKTKSELYVKKLVALNRVLLEWRQRRLETREAVLHADVMLEKIRKIGIVDGEECLQLLEKKGLDKRHRNGMQKAYFALKRACGHQVPQFNSEASFCLF